MREPQILTHDEDAIEIEAGFNPVIGGLTITGTGSYDPATEEFDTSKVEMTLAQFFQKLHITKEDCDRAFMEIPE